MACSDSLHVAVWPLAQEQQPPTASAASSSSSLSLYKSSSRLFRPPSENTILSMLGSRLFGCAAAVPSFEVKRSAYNCQSESSDDYDSLDLSLLWESGYGLKRRICRRRPSVILTECACCLIPEFLSRISFKKYYYSLLKKDLIIPNFCTLFYKNINAINEKRWSILAYGAWWFSPCQLDAQMKARIIIDTR